MCKIKEIENVHLIDMNLVFGLLTGHLTDHIPDLVVTR